MYWFVFHKDRLLLQDSALPKGNMPPVPVPAGKKIHTLPELDGEECRAFHIDNEEASLSAPHSSSCFVGLRSSYDILPLAHYLMAGKAEELLHFDETVRFCSICGSPMHWHTGISKQCTACQREVWPAIKTAIIVRITRGEEILLVRARNFKGTFHGLVAGFLETGETLEECVRREVREETGLEIKNIHYFGSQPWPYPNGLMVGFTAEYESGTLKLQEEELAEAAFFHHDKLPEIPRKLSMARMLIDDWTKRF